MSISSASHAPKAASSLASVIQMQPKVTNKKPDNDADDAPAAKATAPKLATSGPGQVLDRKA